jgi:radical SAM-linked protein
MRAFERALRRTGLPLRLSEGFHPKPRLSFPVPLQVGFEGTDEVMEFDLAGWTAPEKIEALLREQLPEGLDLLALKPVAATRHAARAVGATYAMRPEGELLDDPRLSHAAWKELMGREAIPAERLRKRRRKTVDLRPFLRDVRREGDRILLEVTAGPGGSARPEEVLAAVGFEAEALRAGFRFTRTQIRLAQ